jgi:hypothetical protein
LDNLLVDRRGGRQGFAEDILNDLNKLQAYYVTLYPDRWITWGDSPYEE